MATFFWLYLVWHLVRPLTMAPQRCTGLEMRLHPHKEQLAAEPDVKMTLGAAVSGGTIANETLAYFIARVYQFLLRAGCKAEHVRCLGLG